MFIEFSGGFCSAENSVVSFIGSVSIGHGVKVGRGVGPCHCSM